MNRTILIFLLGVCIISAQNRFYTNPKVVKSINSDISKPLRSMKLIPPGKINRKWKEKGVPNQESIKKYQNKETNPLRYGPDPVLQDKMGTINQVTPIQNWEGINNIAQIYPPDTQGDVGLNHYIQMINLSFQIWDKQGNSLYGPADNSTLWEGYIAPWDTVNDGDPIVLYDEQADRWMLSQFALPNYPNAPFYITIAISVSGDPLGEWYRYAFSFDEMPDYPKFGVWNDGYYLSVNSFTPDGSGSLSYGGVGVAVFERDKMLIGDPSASMIYFDLASTDDPYSMLPSDFDGTPPPIGTPNYFVYVNDDAWMPEYTNDHLRIWEFHADWTTPSNSTFSEVSQLITDPFDSEFTPSNPLRTRSLIKQPGTQIGLDALSSRIMFRLQYRNFGTYSTLVTNHTVDATGTDQAGIRWYELRNYGTNWSIYQQGTYSPDTHSRWMGSIAMDENGNIGLGYSVSSTSVYPSIRYTGRYKDDPLGQMTLIEQEIKAGSGSQTGTGSRWGDYSMMSVDPADNTTFWYTQEYIQTTGGANWRTRIASFTLGASLNLRVYLQGNFTSGVMSTNLNSSGYLPFSHPYGNEPFNFLGADRISLVDADNSGIADFFESNPEIVDWVLVELRNGTDASSKVAQKAGFVKSDGNVVGLDGISPLLFGVPAGEYYIVVYHRNHIPIMSSNSVTMSNNSPASYDFTTGSDKYYGTGGAVQLN